MPDKPMNHEIFATNLKLLCSQRRSVSQVCREIGLNRQQFSRYIAGDSLPSAHNLRRICQYFGVNEADFAQETIRLPDGQAGGSDSMPDPFSEIRNRYDPSELATLRNYEGRYYYYFLSPSWPGQVQAGVMVLGIVENVMRSRYISRVVDPEFGTLMRSRFSGVVAFRGDRLFILEHTPRFNDSFAQTILFPAHRHESNYLNGMSLGVAWYPRRSPFASRVIMKRVREDVPMRDVVRRCGLFDPASRQLDPIVRNFFEGKASPYLASL